MSAQTRIVHVGYTPNSTTIPVGRLALKDRSIYFEYDSQFLRTELQLSPFKLPLAAGVKLCNDIR